MWLIVTLLIWAPLINADNKRNFVIEMHEFHFNLSTPNLIKTLNYGLIKPQYLTIEFAFAKDISEMELHYRLDMIKKDNARINLLSIKIDGCKGLESSYKIPLIAKITKEIFRKSNFPKKCPVKGNELYYIRNYTYDANEFPKFTPIMAFQSFTEFYFEKQYQGCAVLKGRVTKK